MIKMIAIIGILGTISATAQTVCIPDEYSLESSVTNKELHIDAKTVKGLTLYIESRDRERIRASIGLDKAIRVFNYSHTTKSSTKVYASGKYLLFEDVHGGLYIKVNDYSQIKDYTFGLVCR